MTMLRFAWANPHVVSMLPPARRSVWVTALRLSVACLSRLGSSLPSIPEGAGSGEQLASRPCSTDESVAASPPLPVTKRSFLPWALVPFKVLRLPLLPDAMSGKRVAHSRGVAREPDIEGMVFHPLAAREASLRGFPRCCGLGRSTRRDEVATRADPPFAFSALQRDLAPRPDVPPCCQGTTDGSGPPESIRMPKFVSVPDP